MRILLAQLTTLFANDIAMGCNGNIIAAVLIINRIGNIWILMKVTFL